MDTIKIVVMILLFVVLLGLLNDADVRVASRIENPLVLENGDDEP